jgi:hypothetical protein
MPTPTYIPLATITLSSITTSVVFGSIPNSYRDLVLITSGSTTASSDLFWRANGDTNSNYSSIQFGNQDNGNFTNFQSSGMTVGRSGNLGTASSTSILQILDYSATDKNKPSISRGNINATNVTMSASRWINNTTITSLTIFASSNFNSGTTFSLYGIVS